MKKSCSVCGGIHDIKNMCKSHKAQSQTRAAKFRNTSAWRRKRNEVRKRDLNLCRLCLHNKRIRNANSVHHIIELEEDFSLRLKNKNLISVCDECHERFTRQKATKQEIKLMQQLASTPPTIAA